MHYIVLWWHKQCFFLFVLEIVIHFSSFCMLLLFGFCTVVLMNNLLELELLRLLFDSMNSVNGVKVTRSLGGLDEKNDYDDNIIASRTLQPHDESSVWFFFSICYFFQCNNKMTMASMIHYLTIYTVLTIHKKKLIVLLLSSSSIFFFLQLLSGNLSKTIHFPI